MFIKQTFRYYLVLKGINPNSQLRSGRGRQEQSTERRCAGEEDVERDQWPLNLNRTALDDSIEMFFEAVRDVAQAHQMALVAKKSGVGREGLYRSLSKQGNPSWKTVLSVLDVVGLEIPGVQAKTTSSHTPISGSSSSYQARKIRFRSQKGAASRRHRSYSGSVSAQLAFVFPIENANVAKAAAAPSAKSSQPSASAGSSPFDWMPSVQQNKESSNLVFNAMLANQQVVHPRWQRDWPITFGQSGNC